MKAKVGDWYVLKFTHRVGSDRDHPPTPRRLDVGAMAGNLAALVIAVRDPKLRLIIPVIDRLLRVCP